MHERCAKRIEAITGKIAGRSIVLQFLSGSTPDLIPSLGAFMADCAAMCLDSQGHVVGKEMRVSGGIKGKFKLFWGTATDRMKRSLQMDTVVTENGACGVAILIIQSLTQYKIVEQSVRGTGFDYWLGAKNASPALPFARKARLEISGLRSGNDSKVEDRVDIKIDQTKRSDSLNLKAFVVIIEFGKPLASVTIRSASKPMKKSA